MKKAVLIYGLIGVAIVAIIGIIILVSSSKSTKDLIGLKDEDVYFSMTQEKIQRLKGEPDDIKAGAGVNYSETLVYNEDLFSQKADVFYKFESEELRSVSTVLTATDLASAKELFDTAKDEMLGRYKGREGFYQSEEPTLEDASDTDAVEYITFGIEDERNIDVSITLDAENKITINIEKQ